MLSTPMADKTDQISLSISVTKRNGDVDIYDPNKIVSAIEKAIAAQSESDLSVAHLSRRINEKALSLGTKANEKILAHLKNNNNTRIHIESIQDIVELVLMQNNEYELARKYVLYREQQASERSEKLNVDLQTGDVKEKANTEIQLKELIKSILPACEQLVGYEGFYTIVKRGIHKGITQPEIMLLIQMSASSMIKYDPEYARLAALSLNQSIKTENIISLGADPIIDDRDLFVMSVEKGIEVGILDSEVINIYDLREISSHLKTERNSLFKYVGLKTLYDRYLLHHDGQKFESPQGMFMRVAMGLAHKEKNPMEYAVKFYDLLSSFDFVSSTPTLFNSATVNPQLSSCYLTSIPDDLDGIFDGIKDNALLSKYAGGLGNSWTKVRGLGSHIKGTNGESQGVVPFLKVANDTAVAVNQGGKRKGAVCAYLETWHIDIEDFLELRKNTGDDRRRTHDMNTANWIPDLFMCRVAKNEDWTLFSPDETPELTDLYGVQFNEKYLEYEQKAINGQLKNFKVLSATELWKKMLGMLFETGHPWITFKDPCNIRSPQKHMGVVHSSNLCTEITLNTSEKEIAVCNLGSVNLANHVDNNGVIFKDKIGATVTLAIRMLDNVIDYNMYPVEKAMKSNLTHRPIGLGQMGFQDILYKAKIPFDTKEAVEIASKTSELISYYAILASAELAQEKGVYESFEGSTWSQGKLPIDTLEELRPGRGQFLSLSEYANTNNSSLDWEMVRGKIKLGMRNSNVMAIAPTATISNIAGVGQSAEPTYQQIFVKSNLSGEFTHINEYLVEDLKACDLWDQNMAEQIIENDGSIQSISQIPDSLKVLYKNCFEIKAQWLVEGAAAKQTWIDQGISLNLYMAEPSGKELDKLYKLAWVRGLKTTYYLRSIGATSTRESSTNTSTESPVKNNVCSIEDPLECDACQ